MISTTLDFGDLIDGLDELIPELNRTTKTAAREIADRVAARAKKTTSYNNRTGRLRRSTRGRTRGTFSAGTLVAEAVAGRETGPVDYARYVNEGTKKMAPRYFMERAHEKEEDGASEHFQKAIDTAIAGSI